MSATGLVGDMEILVPMAGLIDKSAELTRLQKEIDKLTAEVAKINGKLSNPSFVDKAPAAVVQKEKDRLTDFDGQLVKLQEQSGKIANL